MASNSPTDASPTDREPGPPAGEGDAGRSEPDATTTPGTGDGQDTGKDDGQEYVGRIAGDDVGYAGTTGAEVRGAALEAERDA